VGNRGWNDFLRVNIRCPRGCVELGKPILNKWETCKRRGELSSEGGREGRLKIPPWFLDALERIWHQFYITHPPEKRHESNPMKVMGARLKTVGEVPSTHLSNASVCEDALFRASGGDDGQAECYSKGGLLGKQRQ